MKQMTRKATRHISQNEGLIFEKSSPGKAAWKLPPLDVPEVDTAKLLGKQERKDLGDIPEVSDQVRADVACLQVLLLLRSSATVDDVWQDFLKLGACHFFSPTGFSAIAPCAAAYCPVAGLLCPLATSHESFT